MCCVHLGKCVHCTMLHVLGLVRGNECLCFEAEDLV
jgi:hypothetical protein